MPLLITIGIVLALAIVLLVFFGRNLFKPKLSVAASAKIAKQWSHVLSLADLHRQILEADSVLDMTLQELGFQGSLGEKLKKAGKLLPNQNDVWRAHKLRNRIAHEPGTQISERELQVALKAIEEGIKIFMRK